MNKKLWAFSVLSALIISGFGVANVLASESAATTSKPSQLEELQKRFGITLTDEQKAQVEVKQKEAETKRSEELAKWQSMTLDTWKQQEIARVSATTQAEFDKIKEMHIKSPEQGRGMRGGFNPSNSQEPAE